jgi:hypothetical protein
LGSFLPEKKSIVGERTNVPRGIDDVLLVKM